MTTGAAGADDGAAADIVRINPQLAYLNDNIGTDEVRNDCDWNSNTVQDVVRYSGGHVQVTGENLDQQPGLSLVLQVIQVHTAAGGGFSGAKWLTISGALRDDGKLIDHFSKTAHSVAVFDFTACSVLNKMGHQLGVFTARWLLRAIRHRDELHRAEAAVVAQPADGAAQP